MIKIDKQELNAHERHLATVRRYRQNNPMKAKYQDARGKARSFVNPKAGSLKEQQVNWAGAQYYDDLRDLKARIEQRLKDQEEEHHEEGK